MDLDEKVRLIKDRIFVRNFVRRELGWYEEEDVKVNEGFYLFLLKIGRY